MAGFRAASGGVTVKFGPDEAAVLRSLVSQVAGLIEGTSPVVSAPFGEYVPPAGDLRPAEEGKPGAERIPDADELAAMVGLDEATEPPDDPILARLLPDGYRDDPDAAKEFRRFTESGLRSAKAAAAKAMLDTLPPDGGKIKLSAEDADAWMRALNDVRLAFGVVLGITDDHTYGQPVSAEDEPRRFAVEVYDWLTGLQESLITALS